jgi:hypothetical protein
MNYVQDGGYDGMTAECALSSVLNSNINRTVKCTNCVQMKMQLDDALLQEISAINN